jgi:hypothetical protein
MENFARAGKICLSALPQALAPDTDALIFADPLE